MKKIILIIIITTAFAVRALPQCNGNLKIQSPVSKKPTDATTALVNCSSVRLQWRGNASQDYEFTVNIKDAAENKIIISKEYKHSGNQYSAVIPVTVGNKVSWSVQGIGVINNREFYSYPLRGGKELLIPDCKTPAIASAVAGKEYAVAAKDEKIQVKIFPNPVKSILNVSLNSSSNTQKRVNIFDAYGKTVINQNTIQNNMQIDVKRLMSGTYFITVKDAGGKALFNGKFVKE